MGGMFGDDDDYGGGGGGGGYTIETVVVKKKKDRGAPRKIENKKNALFDADGDYFGDFQNQNKGLVAFEDVEDTKEYRETHYSENHLRVKEISPP